MSTATEPTVTIYLVDLTMPGDRIRHGLLYRSLDIAQRKATEIGSTVTPIEASADEAAELPE